MDGPPEKKNGAPRTGAPPETNSEELYASGAVSATIDFESVRARYPLKEFLEAHGVAVRRSGSSGRFVALCPIHNETTPSFTIYPDQSWRCYGCSRHGDVIDLLTAIEGIPLLDAVKKLGGEFSVITSISQKISVPKLPSRLSNAARERMAAAAHLLATNDDLLARLVAKRPEWTVEGIRGAALDGDLGFEDGAMFFGYSRGIKARAKNAEGERKVWWLCGSSGGELWRQSLMIPWHERIYITEGETDALTLLGMGAEKAEKRALVLALPSAKALPRDPAIFQGKRIIVVADPDQAGKDSAAKLCAVLKPVAKKISILEVPSI